jgi:hypothetical protein
MAECAELEFGLARRDMGLYAVEMRFTQPGSEADVRIGGGAEPIVMAIDPAALREHLLDAEKYGAALGAAVFAVKPVAEMWARAETTAQQQGVPLRLRLAIAADAPELHGLRWETLQDPSGVRVLARQGVLFSRYLGSFDWQPVGLRPQAELRVLVAIANPRGLDAYSLAAIDVAGEWSRVRAAIGDLQATALIEPGAATLANLGERLQDGYDVLYLVAHGSWQRGAAWLWLEAADGSVDRVAGEALVRRIAALAMRPRLIVLASCESSGAGQVHGDSGEAATALGPSLARCGVPAVLAMQGKITVATVSTMMPRLFAELRKDGQVDRALAVARAAVQDRPDWWMPALFMRLRSGRIGYTPGFAEDGGGFEKWPALLQSIKSGRCTPVIGPGLVEALAGSTRELARVWARTYNYPMVADREDLPQVAQFLVVNQDTNFPRDELENAMRGSLRRRYPEAVPEAMTAAPIDELLIAASDWREEHGQQGGHAVLAGLPVPIYITTAVDTLLEHNLRRRGKAPVSGLCAWNGDIGEEGTAGDARPDVQKPLVYHLFGRLDARDSMVLTEDDHFDFLIGVTSNRDLIPVTVRRALADTALLFLGFHMEDWNFRVLFRSIINQQGGGRRKRYAHVAAQIDPEQGRASDPARARRYLEGYFDSADITIYWGSAEDFLRELKVRLEAR